MQDRRQGNDHSYRPEADEIIKVGRLELLRRLVRQELAPKQHGSLAPAFPHLDVLFAAKLQEMCAARVRRACRFILIPLPIPPNVQGSLKIIPEVDRSGLCNCPHEERDV